jgi:alpha-tubulin suppressor-like RCC1 family protein
MRAYNIAALGFLVCISTTSCGESGSEEDAPIGVGLLAPCSVPLVQVDGRCWQRVPTSGVCPTAQPVAVRELGVCLPSCTTDSVCGDIASEAKCIDVGGAGEVCVVPQCDDGKQNRGEAGIDCGGVCKPCGSCGDGVVQEGLGETCDHDGSPQSQCVYGEQSCEVCTAQCVKAPGQVTGFCGDGTIQDASGERCDGAASIVGKSCSEVGKSRGVVACTSCALDYMGCYDALMFTGSRPASVAEGSALDYAVGCVNPAGGATTLAVGPQDSCGGVLAGGVYSLSTREGEGGSTCQIQLVCSSGGLTETQQLELSITAVDRSPSLTNLPTSVSTLWGRTGSFQVTARDEDMPSQALSFSAGVSSCPFPVMVTPAGQVSYTCGALAASCSVDIAVSDGALSATSTLNVACTNQAPSVSAVGLSPAQLRRGGEPLRCAYTFSDPDGDADESLVEWLVDGAVKGQGQGFTDYMPLERVSCRVTPRDGAGGAGAALASTPQETPPDASFIASKDSHACAIKDGALKCWGLNTDYQLGDGTNTNRAVATQVAGLTAGVTFVDVGSKHTCAIHNGALKCWGDNSAGQLGDGTTTDRLAPTSVPGMTAGVTAVSLGSLHTCAIQSGALKCWGDNSGGQLGDGTTTNRLTPRNITSLSANVTRVDAAGYNTCAIQAGSLKCWGYNAQSQLGIGTSGGNQSSPQQVLNLSTSVTDVYTGNSTCALRSGNVMCWGLNNYGQLGNGSTSTGSATPVQVSGVSGSSLLGGATRHFCVSQGGDLKCWGLNNYGATFNANLTSYYYPTINSFNLSDVTKITAGQFYSCVINQGVLLCAGIGTSGQLGSGQFSSSVNPQRVQGL